MSRSNMKKIFVVTSLISILTLFINIAYVYSDAINFIFESSDFISAPEIVGWLNNIGLFTYFMAIFSAWKFMSKTSLDDNSQGNRSPLIPLRIFTLIFIIPVMVYCSFFIKPYSYSDSVNVEIMEVNKKISRLSNGVSEDSETSSNVFFLKKPDRKLNDNEIKAGLMELDNQKKWLEERLSDKEEKQHYFDYEYYALRVLNLGALGAILTLLATSTLRSRYDSSQPSFFHDKNYWHALISNCLAGSIVALIAFSLLYTKQISVFDAAEFKSESSRVPDYWRITLLCLIAGAFSEKLYEAFASKVDRYIESDRKNAGVQSSKNDPSSTVSGDKAQDVKAQDVKA